MHGCATILMLRVNLRSKGKQNKMRASYQSSLHLKLRSKKKITIWSLDMSDIEKDDSVIVLQVEFFLKYIVDLCHTLLDTEFEIDTSQNGLLHNFIHNINPGSLFLIKYVEDVLTKIELHSEWENIREGSSSIVIILKGQGTLQNRLSCEEQLTVTMIPAHHEGKSNFELIRSLVNYGIAPYFDSLVTSAARDTTIETARKKMTELLVSLEHLQQTIQVPNLQTSAHPKVVELVESGKSSVNQLDEDVLSDSSFINSLQSVANNWIKLVQNITSLEHLPNEGSTSEELNFWISKEAALHQMSNQISGSVVSLTLDILRSAKRFHATVSFLSDTGIDNSIEEAQIFNQLYSDFPISELLSASSLTEIASSIDGIFNHLRKIRILNFPLERALLLLDALSFDFSSKIVEATNSLQLMDLELEQFLNSMKDVSSVIAEFEDHSKEFVSLLREISRKRNEKFVKVQNSSQVEKIKDRLSYVSELRESHNDMKSTALQFSESFAGQVVYDFGRETELAYEPLKELNVLDFSEKGRQTWETLEGAYFKRINDIENRIISLIADLLSNAKTSNEMFGILENFQFLLSRSNIRQSLQEYQSQLLVVLYDDLKGLRLQLNRQQLSQTTFQLRNIFSFNSAIIWTSQMVSKLNFLLYRVELVLSSEWRKYPEGKKIDAEVSILQMGLNISNLYSLWILSAQSIAEENIAQSKVLKIAKNKITGDLEIETNFDFSFVSLISEVKALKTLNFDVPRNIFATAETLEKIYPYAKRLQESCNVLKIISSSLSSLGDFKILLAPHIQDILNSTLMLQDANWEKIYNAHDILDADMSFELEEIDFLKSILTFERLVSSLIRKVDKLKHYRHKIEKSFNTLSNKAYCFKEIQNSVLHIQKLVNGLAGEGFAIGELVVVVNNILQKLFQDRCRRQLESLKMQFEGLDIDSSSLLFKIYFNESTMRIAPPLESFKDHWLCKVEECIGIVALQKPLTVETPGNEGSCFENFFEELKTGFHSDISRWIVEIDQTYKSAQQFFTVWAKLQGFWDLDIDEVTHELGSNIDLWNKAFQDLIFIRNTFDTIDSKKTFKSLTIDYQQVQTRVFSHFSNLQRTLSGRYGVVLYEAIKENVSMLRAHISDLEEFSAEISNSTKIVAFLSVVFRLLNDVVFTDQTLSNCDVGQKILMKNKYKFDSSWIYTEQLYSEYRKLQMLIGSKQKFIESNKETIKVLVKDEVLRIESHTRNLMDTWNEDKSIGHNQSFSKVMKMLNDYSEDFQNIKISMDRVNDASTLLNMTVKLDIDFSLCLDEVENLKLVFNSIGSLTNSYEELCLTKWIDTSPSFVKTQLDTILNESRTFPSKLRQYPVFENLQNLLKDTLKVIPTIKGLKADALLDRHWVEIFEKLSDVPYRTNLTVGDVLSLDLNSNEQFIKSIIQKAQGEKGVADSLDTIEDRWRTYKFELFNYDQKHILVKGWDSIFQSITEDLNLLSSMKQSQYYLNFEKKASILEEKLHMLHGILDIWIDIQREWVYLHGVFEENKEIKKLLPTESARFHNVSSEFYNTVNPIFNSPVIIECISISNVLPTFKRLSVLLGKIKKTLVGYLESQRDAWPRFYFLGNEDLLEIIACVSNPSVIGTHIRKLFPAVSKLLIDEKKLEITGLISLEGETLSLHKPVPYSSVALFDWLQMLENEIRKTLSLKLDISKLKLLEILDDGNKSESSLFSWVDNFPFQILLLSLQVCWTHLIEKNIKTNQLPLLKDKYLIILEELTRKTQDSTCELQRRKVENLIAETIHQLGVLQLLLNNRCTTTDNFYWLSHQRYYYDDQNSNLLTKLTVQQGNASFVYGFEYMGAPERLVTTPLVEEYFLGMSEAINQKLGGSLIGPAGTGKTETIKALAQNIGRMVLVFCCDETFNFQAVSRILSGICRIGAWACFDEFNRLDPQTLSSLSTQIEKIEDSLASKSSSKIELLGKYVEVHTSTGVFITSNPTYSGRSALPDNLKSKYRTMSVTRPESVIISDVILASQGFGHSKQLAEKLVTFFANLLSECSSQPHYDFGLRALKSMLIQSGKLRRRLFHLKTADTEKLENGIISQSLHNIVLPKLLPSDEKVFQENISIFENNSISLELNEALRNELQGLALAEGLQINEDWIKKALQLYEIQKTHHGLMMIGPSGSGKSSTMRLLLNAMERIDMVENVVYQFDPKVIGKKELYGTLDSATRQWTDGVFTSILRKAETSLRGEKNTRIWIVLDGDVDPLWVENLNSVLDDNKVLTLPNGERISFCSNVRVVMEVQNLNFATPATISRCGIVWFSSSTVSLYDKVEKMIFEFLSTKLNNEDYINDSLLQANASLHDIKEKFYCILKTMISASALDQIVSYASSKRHVMSFIPETAVKTSITLLKHDFEMLLKFFVKNPAYIQQDITPYVGKKLLIALLWGFGGGMNMEDREMLSEFLTTIPHFSQLCDGLSDSLVYADVSVPRYEWTSYLLKVPDTSLETHMVLQPDVIIPTVDTVRHDSLIFSALTQRRPVILCGPPGSGKTMSLIASLKSSEGFTFVSLSFSKETSVDIIIKALEQHCVYKQTANGLILTSAMPGKWIVAFCDEINIASVDKYGTQTAISLLRQLIESKGFWRKSDSQWVKLERIQFVGACNPSSDPGRNVLSNRFLHHCSVFFIGYPSSQSLHQIYGTFNDAVLKCAPELKGLSTNLTEAMVSVYQKSASQFTTAIMPHYIYSPRELTRWVRGIYSSIKASYSLSVDELLRVWLHEALRLFCDRLADDTSKLWTMSLLKSTIHEFFPLIDAEKCFRLPILYSDWLSYEYSPVSESALRSFVTERLRVFCEEELDTSLVLFNSSLDHILRIDRVLRNSQGHMILVGPSGSGKSTLSKFVAWMNGIETYQLNSHSGYSLSDFDNTLKELLIKCGTDNQKILFLIDESNISESSFIERMNNILANAEIPGLFDEEELNTLLSKCSQVSQEKGLFLDSEDELYSWFTSQISKNFHVIFTFSDLYSKKSQILSSPALFNRCVINWMGDWDENSMRQVAESVLNELPIVSSGTGTTESEDFTFIGMIVFIHMTIRDTKVVQDTTITPGQFLSLLSNFKGIYLQKDESLQSHQTHVNIGLDKLKDTVIKVKEMKEKLSRKKTELDIKDTEAREMLDKMIVGQNEAERKQEASIEIQKLLESQELEIYERKKYVFEKLDEVEPLIIEALSGVKNIKKQHLTELRSLANPPEIIRITLESVCVLLGYKVGTWRDVQMVIRKDDFIASIVSFDSSENVQTELLNYMESKYLSRKDFNFESADRASKACGPLLLWVQAQLRYATIADQISPLREEVHLLEEESVDNKAKFTAINGMIKDLQDTIKNYKDSYSEIIRQSERIKTEMTDVHEKVERSVKLMENLTEERLRWQESTKSFDSQRKTIVGDSLLSAVFMTYCGSEEQTNRSVIEKIVTEKLETANVPYDKTTDTLSKIANLDDLIKWEHEYGLPNDVLFFENCSIMFMNHTNKFDFMIDPSNIMIDFLINSASPNEISITSFLDDGYRRVLENCLKFGGTVIIQDAENYDSLINRIISRNIEYSGGRSTVLLGDRRVDMSPNFKLYLHTKDSSYVASSFITSRMNVLNFTFTDSSLTKKALNMSLEYIAPDIDAQRIALLKAQGTNKRALLTLEKDLLDSISKSENNLLEDNTLVEKLAIIKADAKSVSDQLENATTTLENIETKTELFRPLASAFTVVHKLLESISSLNCIYQYDPEYTFNIFQDNLKTWNSNSYPVSKIQVVEKLMVEFFVRFFRNTVSSFLQQDRSIFGLMLFALAKQNENQFNRDKWLHMINYLAQGNNTTGTEELMRLASDEPKLEFMLKGMMELLSEVDNLNQVTSHWFSKASVIENTDNSTSFEKIVDLHHIPKSPVLLRVSEGVDISLRVIGMANFKGVKIKQLAMGSDEATNTANSLVSKAATDGDWVLIENVQYSNQWLNDLSRLLDSIPHLSPKFMLFLTCGVDSTIPPKVEKLSRRIVFENDPGVKTIMNSIILNPNSQMNKDMNSTGMIIKRHLYFLISWFHSLILERSRFSPTGFSKDYNFNEQDLYSAKYFIDECIDRAAMKRSNMSAEDIPWYALQYMTSRIVYGGRVDNAEDLTYLIELASHIFTYQSFDYGYDLLCSTTNDKLPVPEGRGFEDYEKWISALPDIEPVEWLDLPSGAARDYAVKEIQRIGIECQRLLNLT